MIECLRAQPAAARAERLQTAAEQSGDLMADLKAGAARAQQPVVLLPGGLAERACGCACAQAHELALL